MFLENETLRYVYRENLKSLAKPFYIKYDKKNFDYSRKLSVLPSLKLDETIIKEKSRDRNY